MLLFMGGLQYPIPAAIGGTVWLIGKVAFSNGYYTGGMRSLKYFIEIILIHFYRRSGEA